jgi:hypothetical protein
LALIIFILFIKESKLNKLTTNLVVGISAFFIGLASASALNKADSDKQAQAIQNNQVDAMGNVVANQD